MHTSFRILALFLFYCATTSVLKAQDIEAQGNLWIVTLDKSRSMTDVDLGYRAYVFNKLLDSKLYSEIDFSKDAFVFYNSGIIYMPGKNYSLKKVPMYLKRENRRSEGFRQRFIRKATRKETPWQFDNSDKFERSFQRIYGSWNTKNFPYATSFVSLIQPLALASFLEDYKDLDLQQYNQIILCSITDDADQTDQWLKDYKTVRKLVPNKQQEIDSILGNLIYSPFNVKSTGRGAFSAVFPPIEKNGKPKLFAYAYTTRQGLRKSAAADSAIEILTQESDSITLKINTEISQNHLVKLDSIVLNDELLPLTYPIVLQKDSIQKIPVTLNSVFDNTISLHGVGQEIYNDDLLGNRIQKITIDESHSGIYAINSPLHRSSLLIIGVVLLFLILLWIAYYIYKLHLPKCIIIGPSGETTIIKNGFKRSETKKKIQYAGFTKEGNHIALVRLKNQFITHEQLTVDTAAAKKWIAVISKKNLLFLNEIDVFQFQKGDAKHIQGVETTYHAKIRKKYGNKYAIYFIQYPTTDTTLNFTIKDDDTQNEYHIHTAVIEEDISKNKATLQNERMISNLFLKNSIATHTDYLVLCNKIEEENTSLLYVNLIQPYTLKTFLPIQIVKHYKIKLNAADSIETIINREVAALEEELKQQDQKGTLKTHYQKNDEMSQLLAIAYPFFPVNLSLGSNEDNASRIRLQLYNSIGYSKEAVEKDTLHIKMERPSDAMMEPYSMQLLWHPHSELYDMHLTDRKLYAINGKNYMDIGNPDTITLDVTKNNDQYTIECQGQTLTTNVQDYFYKPIKNE
ncbi:MAG: hypothetical protein AAF611_06605 [Bacteroidota bacterium]